MTQDYPKRPEELDALGGGVSSSSARTRVAAAALPDPGAVAAADRELERLYSAITSRPAFRYDQSADPLYRSAADQYVQNGRLAMRHAAGSAAALTGGYGSSYAAAVGQQQFDEYLRALSALMPEYYDRAYRQYADSGEALARSYDMAAARRDDLYRRQRDWESARREEEKLDAAASANALKAQQAYYAQLLQLIQLTGYEPSDEELAAAGMSSAAAEALLKKYRPRSGGGGGGGSGSSAAASGRVGKATSAAAAAKGTGK